MKIRLWLKPVSSDGQYIQMDKGKYPKFLICVPDTNPPRDAWPCFLCKVDHNDASNQPCPPPSPRPLHYICPLLWTKTVWWSVSTPNKWWSPASHVKQQKGQLSPPPSLFLHHGFLLCNIQKERKFNPPQTPYQGVLRYYQALLRYLHWTYCAEQEIWYVKDLFSVPTSGMTVLYSSVYDPHMSILGDIYFCFPILLYIYWHNCVM